MPFDDSQVVLTADEAIEAAKEAILEETSSRRPTINQNALGVTFLNLQNVYLTFLYLWFVAMAVVATLILFGVIHVDDHNRSIYMGTSIIVTGFLIMGMLIISGFYQERNRNLSRQHFLNINIPWMCLVAFSVAIALAYSLLDTEIDNEIGEDIFDDDDSFTVEKFEGKFSEAIIYAFYVIAFAFVTPYMIKAVFSHINPQIESPEPEFTSNVRLAVEQQDHHPESDSRHNGNTRRKSGKKKATKNKNKAPTNYDSGYRSCSRPPIRSIYG